MKLLQILKEFDKKKHAVLGIEFLVVGLAFGAFFYINRLYTAYFFPALAAVGKDVIWDKWLSVKFEGKKLLGKTIIKGTFDWWDMWTTILPAYTINTIFIVVMLIFKWDWTETWLTWEFLF